MSRNQVPKKKPDYPQFTARFGCGFLVGMVMAAGCSLIYGAQTMPTLIAAWIVFALIFGLLAAYFGDKFWQNIIHWFPWF
jgi:ABC-type dipeptide/oligopeptide/nickel transport system permease subunit